MEIEGTYEMQTFGITNDNLIDEVSLNDDVNEVDEERSEDTDGTSVEIISDTCAIYKYYSEDTVVVVQRHFTRSLQEHLRKLTMNSQVVDGEIQSKATGQCKRKLRTRKRTISSSQLPPNQLQVSNAVGMTIAPNTSRYILPRNVEKQWMVAPHYTTAVQPPTSGYQYKTTEYTIRNNVPRQSAYNAYCDGTTLVEIYSPTVGRGFNPRFNTLLIQPTLKSCYLPTITAQPQVMPPSQVEMDAFLRVAITFDLPTQ